MLLEHGRMMALLVYQLLNLLVFIPLVLLSLHFKVVKKVVALVLVLRHMVLILVME